MEGFYICVRGFPYTAQFFTFSFIKLILFAGGGYVCAAFLLIANSFDLIKIFLASSVAYVFLISSILFSTFFVFPANNGSDLRCRWLYLTGLVPFCSILCLGVEALGDHRLLSGLGSFLHLV